MKTTYLLFLLSILSLNLFCQVQWTKHPDNPVMVPGSAGEWDEDYINPGSIIYYENTYHMWYSGSWLNPQIGHATSPDGINWTKDTNNPVLEMGQEGEWDENTVCIEGSSILIIDSIFHMWYTGHNGTNFSTDYRIGHATSPDGINWTKDSNNPVLKEDGTDEWNLVGSVVYDGIVYHMWNYAYNAINYNGHKINHFTSPDAVTWTKDPLYPVLERETGQWDYPRVSLPEVIFDGTTYHMWYVGGEYFNGQIGYATSEDGSVWTKYDNNPVLGKGQSGDWDDYAVSRSIVIDSADIKYKMWYHGCQAAETGSIGYAESIINETLVEGQSTPGIFIYPNPINSFLTIETALSDLYNIEISSLNGQLLFNDIMEGTTHQFDLSSFKSGVYFINIRSRDFVTTRKVIKL